MTRWLDGMLLSDGLMRGLGEAAAKAPLLFLVAWLIVRFSHRSSAAFKHRIWALTLCALIALPVASMVVPGWWMPASITLGPTADPPAGTSPPSATRLEPVGPPRIVSMPPSSRVDPLPLTASSSPAREVVPPSDAEEPASRPGPPEMIASNPIPSGVDGPSWTIARGLLAVWWVGFLGVCVPTLVGLLSNEGRRRRSQPVSDEAWVDLLQSLRRRLAIGRNVELRRGSTPIPITWGILRPVILLPKDCGLWTPSARRRVLLHELAHVRRLDAGILIAGRFAAALYWFHPLVWFAFHRLRIESEHACDDRVVLAGECPADYASQLLEMTRSLRGIRCATALAMARSSILEERMKALFDDTRDHLPLARRSGRLLAIVAAALVLGLATVHQGHSAAARDDPPAAPSTSTPPAREAEINSADSAMGRIEGRVVIDASGRGAPGADVILLLPPPEGQDVYYGKLPLRKTVTDPDGQFAFDGLSPGRHRVWANFGKLTSRDQRAAYGEVILIPESGDAPNPVELRLGAGVLVTALVKEEATGRPVPNATVGLGWSDFPDDFTADERGLAQVQPLTAERWLIEARADGFAKASQWVNLETGSDARFEFSLKPGGGLEGTVVDAAGVPLAGVGLGIVPEGSHEQLDYVETDSDGRYTFTHVPLGVNLQLNARTAEYLPREITTLLSEATQTLDITMQHRPHGGSIAGLVLDREGRPIAGAELVNTGSSSSDVRETKSGPDGRFRLDDLFEGSIGKEVLVRARGFAPKRIRVEPGPADEPARLTIELDPGHRISGRVTDEEGNPLGGVRVYFAQGNRGFSDGGETTTDDQGRFAFDSLPPDAPFSFVKRGYSEIEDRPLPLDTDEEISVEMVPAGVLLGEVVDATTGEPIPDFNVQITYSPDRRPDEPSAGLLSSLIDPGQRYSSGNGRFKLGDLVVGMPFQVMISADGYERSVERRVVAARPSGTPPREYRLERINPADLVGYRGQLLDADGDPVAGAQLRLIAARNRDPHDRRHFPFNWSMIQTGQLAQQAGVSRFEEAGTDAQGRFAFDRIPNGDEVELVWWGEGIPPGRADHLERLDATERDSIVVTVPKPARITGTIDRKAFDEAGLIQVLHAEGLSEFIGITLDPDQTEFEVGDLAAGKYFITLMSPYERSAGGPANSLTNRSLDSIEVEVEAGETRLVDFED